MTASVTRLSDHRKFIARDPFRTSADVHPLTPEEQYRVDEMVRAATSLTCPPSDPVGRLETFIRAIWGRDDSLPCDSENKDVG